MELNLCGFKKLIEQIGWFDQNFVMAYYEDEDWYLRYREWLGLFNDPVSYDEIVPKLKVITRNTHRGGKWNVAANYIYFFLKWKKQKDFTSKSLHSRQLDP